LGRLIGETSLRRISPDIEPVSLTKRFIYDVLDRLVSEVLPDGTAKCWEYDHGGHILETFIVLDAHPDSLQKVPPNQRLQRNRWEYDAMGREIRHRDPAGLVTTREWDSRGLCTAIIDSRGARTEFSYDRDGKLKRECTDRGYEIKLTYDAAGRVV